MVAGKLNKYTIEDIGSPKILWDWVEEWYNWVMSYFLNKELEDQTE
jgi:hypothetical protein